MRLLFLAPSPPLPSAGGGSLRMYHMVRTLGHRFELDLVGPALTGSAEATELLRGHCREIEFVPPRIGPLRRMVRLGPYEHDPAMAEAIERRLTTTTYDAVQVEKPAMLVYLPPRLEVPVILDIWAYGLAGAIRALRHEPGFLARTRNLIRLARFSIFDRFCWPALSGILVVSEIDRQRCLKARPGTKVRMIPNGVDCAVVRPEDRPARRQPRPPVIVFTGDMSFAPNIEAAVLLARSIFPKVRALNPDVQLHVVGRTPHPRVQSLSGPGIKVIGEVRDMVPYLQEAMVFVAPHFTGAGTRTKVLEAMAAGLPIVTTSVGIEGIEAQPAVHVLIADDPEGIAAAVSRLLGDAPARKDLATAARRLAEERYDWGRCLAPLVELYASLGTGHEGP